METNNVQQAHNNELGPKIPELFRGKVVLITGATGFVGKVLLEKLLRSCPGISEILLLLRSHKKDCNLKFQDLIENKVFDRVRAECPGEMGKMRWMEGDATKADLGLSEQDLKRVKEEVSFIFHCAASVRFDGDPKETFMINLVAVKNILDVCRRMKTLQALVHVSTAYSFCNQGVVCEQIYPERIAPNRIMDSLTWMNPNALKELCKIVVNRPTLYHYSKALAEIYLAENHENVPVVIVRPSVITASFRDPFPGWIDNYNGPSGFIALSSKGIIRTLLVKKEIIANWVPVDIVANTLIVAAYTIATQRENDVKILNPWREHGIPIVNCVCPQRNSKTWLELINMCIPLLSKYPSSEFFRQPGGGTVTSCPAFYFSLKCMSHYAPAVFIDFFKFITFRQVNMVRNYRRIHGVMNNLHHYTTHPFVFYYTNMSNLIYSMSVEDKEIFPIDQQALNWQDYMENYVHGVRKYFLKESDDTLAPARSKLKRYQKIWFWSKLAVGIATLTYLNKHYLRMNRMILANYIAALSALCDTKYFLPNFALYQS